MFSRSVAVRNESLDPVHFVVAEGVSSSPVSLVRFWTVSGGGGDGDHGVLGARTRNESDGVVGLRVAADLLE